MQAAVIVAAGGKLLTLGRSRYGRDVQRCGDAVEAVGEGEAMLGGELDGHRQLGKDVAELSDKLGGLGLDVAAGGASRHAASLPSGVTACVDVGGVSCSAGAGRHPSAHLGM